MTTKMNINKRCIQTPAYYHIFTLYLVVFTWSLVKVWGLVWISWIFSDRTVTKNVF